MNTLQLSWATKALVEQTLLGAGSGLQNLHDDWFVIGASALLLSGVPVGQTGDIDILTTQAGSKALQQAWLPYKESAPETKEDNLFRSEFARFRMPQMYIEVMGNLQICKEGVWQDVQVRDWREVQVGSLRVKVPTLAEQKRILMLFGRPKDLRRILIIDQFTAH